MLQCCLLLISIIVPNRTGDIEGFCEVLLDPTYSDETDLDAFVRWYTRRVFGNNPGDSCVDATFDVDVAVHRNITWGSAGTRSSLRQWYFQTCNEFGWYETSGSRFQPFTSSFPVDMFHRWCSDVYGEMLSLKIIITYYVVSFLYHFRFTAEFIHANVERKNVIFGGLNPNVNNVSLSCTLTITFI